MKKQVKKELNRIQDSIPADMKKRLIRNQYASPTVRKILRLALKDESVSQEKKDSIQTIIDTGIVDKKEDVINQTAQKEIDNYVDQEIAKSIVAGRLPRPKDNSLFDKYIKKCKKGL